MIFLNEKDLHDISKRIQLLFIVLIYDLFNDSFILIFKNIIS